MSARFISNYARDTNTMTVLFTHKTRLVISNKQLALYAITSGRLPPYSPITCCGTAALTHRAMERRSGPILSQREETCFLGKDGREWEEQITTRSTQSCPSVTLRERTGADKYVLFDKVLLCGWAEWRDAPEQVAWGCQVPAWPVTTAVSGDGGAWARATRKDRHQVKYRGKHFRSCPTKLKLLKNQQIQSHHLWRQTQGLTKGICKILINFGLEFSIYFIHYCCSMRYFVLPCIFLLFFCANLIQILWHIKKK